MNFIIASRIGNEYKRCDIPSSSKQLLKINTSDDRTSLDETSLVRREYDGNDKWCNGFSHWDFIYGIPSSTKQFLKFNIKTEISELVGDDLSNDELKWISGVVADDGCLYCFPFEHNRILKCNQMTIQQHL